MAATKARATCGNCGRRRNTDKLILLFKHPTIYPGGLYACFDNLRSCRYRLESRLAMFPNTGVYSLVKDYNP